MIAVVVAVVESRTTLAVLVGLAAGTYALKAAGPLLLGGRSLPPALDRIAQQLPAALLAALVVVSGAAVGQSLHLDARLVGVAAAAIALWRRLPFVVVVAVAVASTALTRVLL